MAAKNASSCGEAGFPGTAGMAVADAIVASGSVRSENGGMGPGSPEEANARSNVCENPSGAACTVVIAASGERDNADDPGAGGRFMHGLSVRHADPTCLL